MIFAISPRSFCRQITDKTREIQIPQYGVNLAVNEVERLRNAGVTQVHDISEFRTGNPPVEFIKKLSQKIVEIFNCKTELIGESIGVQLFEDPVRTLSLMVDVGNQGLIIEDMEVEEAHQGQGIGREMLRSVETIGRELGVRYLTVDMSINNQWWISQGFSLEKIILEHIDYARNLDECKTNIDEAIEMSSLGVLRKSLVQESD